MPKKKPPKKGEKPQIDRFVAAARSVGVSETGKGFDATFDKVVKRPTKAPKRNSD